MKVSSIFSRLATLLASFVFVTAAHGATASRPLSSSSFSDTLSDAAKIASRHSDMQVLRIEGKSMLPFFGEGSVVIVKKIAAESLQAGMVVVYQNRFGETVAHRLIAQTNDGWVAQGFNNNAADTTHVNASNLMGVVYATLHSDGNTQATAALTSLMSQTGVALAAPAK